ncbi:MAG: indolepyruvate oxidoreductase subunit beta [Syntrophaceae bacterium]|nr:indolepyruvate oxidoreductase subunit beta [Syntrophaceae bacterium]
MKSKDPINLIITGVGGQGNILISRLIGQILVDDGYFVTIGEIYGLSQRGGSVASHVRIAKKEMYSPLTPTGCADIILGLEPIESLRVGARFGNNKTFVLSNTRPIHTVDPMDGEGVYPSLEDLKKSIGQISQKAWFIDASAIALEMGTPLFTNIIMTGALVGTGLLPIDKKMFEDELKRSFDKNKLTSNIKAFHRGFDELTSQIGRKSLEHWNEENYCTP